MASLWSSAAFLSKYYQFLKMRFERFGCGGSLGIFTLVCPGFHCSSRDSSSTNLTENLSVFIFPQVVSFRQLEELGDD
jgi:hypothetical protein